jgi:hypothetical protein
MVTEFRRVQVVICEQTRDKGASNECATAVYDPQLTESVIVFRYGSVTYIVTLHITQSRSVIGRTKPEKEERWGFARFHTRTLIFMNVVASDPAQK